MTRSPAWARTVFVVVLATYGAAPATAWAHPQIERGRRQYEDANFRQALLTLRRALSARELTRDDLVRLYETRALVRLAMHQQDDYVADLRTLASIDPEHAFAREVPPEVVTEFARVRATLPGPLRVAVTTAPVDHAVELTARVENDELHLSRRLQFAARRTGSAEWADADAGQVTVPAGPGDRIEYAAVAIGTGDAVLASAGTRDAPLTFQVPRLAPVLPPATSFARDSGLLDDDPTDDEGGGGPSPWIWVSAGTVGVAVAVVLIVLATSSGTDDTQPSVPMVPGY